MKGVQCYELFGGIALKVHTFSFSWKKQVEVKIMKVWLIRVDVLCRSRWIVGVNMIATRLR